MANSTADGSVVIDVNMDVSQAEKRLAKLRGDIIAVQCLNKKDEDGIIHFPFTFPPFP